MERKAETWTLSKKQYELNAWREYSSHEIDLLKELHADFNFAKIHLTSQWVEQIRKCRA